MNKPGKLLFNTLKAMEDYLETHYLNRVIQFTLYKSGGPQLITGKVDRIAYDMATKNPPVVIIILSDDTRYEIETDEFLSIVKLIN